jgi:hypothetical protein
VSDPQIIVGYEAGAHNESKQTVKRLKSGRQYQDLSTVMIVPTRGTIPARVVECWMGMLTPMNNAFTRIFISGMEVGDAYNAGIELVLNHPELSKWKYILTVEEDNLPPPDGVLKLLETIGDHGAIGGLYYTKGEGGQPMIYGSPERRPQLPPQPPVPEAIQPCNGLGMGFTLFKTDLFRDEKIERPWFKTVNEWSPQTGAQGGNTGLALLRESTKGGVHHRFQQRGQSRPPRS